MEKNQAMFLTTNQHKYIYTGFGCFYRHLEKIHQINIYICMLLFRSYNSMLYTRKYYCNIRKRTRGTYIGDAT